MKIDNAKNWPIAALFLALTYLLGHEVEQHEFWKIMGCYVPFFIGYIYVAKNKKIYSSGTLTLFISIAILCRLILVFALPNLSNDIYRFIWDGRLLVNGFNPFDHLPMYYLENNIDVPGISRELFERYGSKNFHTVYPPVAQAQFGSAVWLFPDNIYGASVVMKLWLFFFEIGSIWLMVKLLRQFNLPAWNVLWYALNPLIIFEITGNLHFEGAMIFFLLLAVWLISDTTIFKKIVTVQYGIMWPSSSCLPTGRYLAATETSTEQLRKTSYLKLLFSAMAFALSICSKLLTILFLPFFIRILGWKKAAAYYMFVGVFTVLFFVPIVNDTFLSNFGDSLNLYFQKLEFNASLYYLFRWVGFQISGYNQIAVIGPYLGLMAMGVILWMAFAKRFENLTAKPGGYFQLWLFAICFYLACTTTMHPWYVAMPVALCVFTKWRFPIVWSGMIFLTYINYSHEIYHENLWVVGLEYAVVFGWFVWEKRQ